MNRLSLIVLALAFIAGGAFIVFFIKSDNPRRGKVEVRSVRCLPRINSFTFEFEANFCAPSSVRYSLSGEDKVLTDTSATNGVDKGLGYCAFVHNIIDLQPGVYEVSIISPQGSVLADPKTKKPWMCRALTSDEYQGSTPEAEVSK